MEKLNMHSPDFTAQNVAKLAELFPNCVTESKDDKGHLRRSIDFDLLRQELSTDIVEGLEERYRLDWPGKASALITANTPIDMTLRPFRRESVDFDTTQNLFIEGDNLDVLKLLQETYLSKVKMIYIDPPYNTGNDFIYTDKFNSSRSKNDIAEKARDEEGTKLIDEAEWKRNRRYNGRFHSDWLTMMYPRLKLARNLLKDDGVIFISIDDSEVENLRKLCAEIFGAENLICCFIWKSKSGGANDSSHIAVDHEYILVYGRTASKVTINFDKNATVTTNYNLSDEKGEYSLDRLDKQSLGYLKSLDFPIEGPDGEIYRVLHKNPTQKVARWRWGKETVAQRYDELVFKGGFVYTKNYRKDGTIPRSLLIEDRFGRTRTGKTELATLLEGQFFNNPKASKFIKFLIQIATLKDDIILDFFAGSATTAHAVMQLNAEDGSKRKFIMVQLPEDCDKKSEAFKAGYENIAEISKERIRRASKKIKEENAEVTDNLDIGFRVLKIDTSNMVDIENTPDAIEQGQLKNLIENIKQDRGSEDLLFQVLLNWGVDLTLPITTETIKGLEVFFVDKNALVACFERPVTEELCKELATRKPLRVVFRDSSFENDSVKVNVEQIFKLLSPGTDVKTI